MTYEEHIREVAEEMARLDEPASMELYDKLLNSATQTDAVILTIEKVVERYKPFAIISVRRESEAVRKVLNRLVENKEYAEEYLIDLCLIPDPKIQPTLDHDPDTCMHDRVNMGYCMDCGNRI